MPVKAALLSAVSGAVWGLMGFLLTDNARASSAAWAACIASPLIGLGAGWLALRARSLGPFASLMFALLNLYIAVALFILVYLFWHMTTHTGPLPTRESGAVGVLRVVTGLLLGFTALGWPLFLWPLSVANQTILFRVADGPHSEFVDLRLR